ncbi:WD repeat-containing protein-like protein [Xylogone sp. PMI_703]|nr:WD repeat-containing protein-like protein [Xylogone sp. PMI_703]
MSSTPMAIDSPMPPAGLGLGSRPVNGALATAKVTDMISIFRPTKLFRREVSGASKPGPTSILSLDFDDPGELLLTSESDNSLQIYNLKEGKHSKACLSQKYGAMHAIFAHANSCVIHSSTKINHTIRYLSTHDNSYLRYFEGHEDNVTCLALHPGQDTFISCSEDDTVRLWDAGSKNGLGKLYLKGAYLSAWDPSGNVFAIASPVSQSVLLYDFRNFDKEPFATFDILEFAQEVGSNAIVKGWNKIEFSNDGKHLLLGTTGDGHFLMDAFDGHLKSYLKRERGGTRRLGSGEHNSEGMDPNDALLPSTGDCSFTPDGRYVLSGMKRENIAVWDTLATSPDKKGSIINELEFKGEAAVLAVNPRYNFFATGDKELVFWVPDPHAA